MTDTIPAVDDDVAFRLMRADGLPVIRERGGPGRQSLCR
ncbi:hypothetical protein ACVMAJ_004341 [Bradyrhizobium sp. USDA 4448]